MKNKQKEELQAEEKAPVSPGSAADSIENPYRRRCLWMLVLSCIPVLNCALVFEILAIIYGVRGKKWARAYAKEHGLTNVNLAGYKFSQATMIVGIVMMPLSFAEAYLFITYFISYFIGTVVIKTILQGILDSCSGSTSEESLLLIGRLFLK